MNTHYKILPETELILEYYKGNIYLSDIIEMKSKMVAEKNYNPNYKFIGDLRNADLMLSDEEIANIVDTAEKREEINTKRQSALLTKTSNQTVKATIYKMSAEKLPIDYKIFPTLKTALEWLNIAFENEMKIERMFFEMSKEL